MTDHVRPLHRSEDWGETKDIHERVPRQTEEVTWDSFHYSSAGAHKEEKEEIIGS